MEWTKIGNEFTKNKQKIKDHISRLDWQKAVEGMRLPAMPGMGISGVIKEFRIPAVSHIAISHEMSPLGLYGVRAHYKKSGTMEIYFVDTGDAITPIGSRQVG